MKTPKLFLVCILFLIPILNYGQAPDLGTTASFALFTATGAFNVSGASTLVTGDVGTNVGAFTGFPPGILIGNIYVADPVSAQAALDVASAYGDLAGENCVTVLGVTLGNNQILTPDIYCTGAATTINGDLILDAQGDPNAIFIFQIDGALSTGTLANVILINGASLCNVYWQVNGEFTLGEGSLFQGTLINSGAIYLLEGATLLGRALSTAGAIDLHNNIVTVTLNCSVLTIACPPNLTIQCTVSTLPAITGTVSVTDNCGTSPVIIFSDVVTAGGCDQSFTISRTWNVTDLCGNEEECVQMIEVTDTTNPVISCPTVTSPIECPATPEFGTATATDGCDAIVDITFTDETIPGSCPQEYSITRTWTAIDDCGNTSECSRTVVVQDNTPPVITCPVVVSPLECGTAPTFGTPTASDACDGTVDVSFTDETIPGSCPQEYSVTRTWTAIDDCGNTSECSRTVVVQDNTPPVITCPVVVSPLECGTAPTFGTPTAIDACDGTVDVSFTDETIPGSCPQEYSVTRTWTAIDDCGNTSQCSRTVVVQDNTPPVITCPVVVSPLECGTAPTFGTPTAIDACDGTVDVSFTDETIPGSCPQEYSVTRTWTAIDDCGNTSECSRTVVVQDNTAPVITCPVVVSPLECGTAPTFGTPTAIDACDGTVDVSFTDETIPGSCPQEYSVTRTWIAIDDCGNTSECSRTVVVQDNTAPVITCPVVVSPLECGTAPTFGTPTAIDACDGTVDVSFTDETISGSCPQEYSVTRTWIAIDDCGNTSQCSRTVVVQDNTPPVITCPVVVSPLECGTAPTFGTPTAIDACDGTVDVSFTDETIPGSCPQEYSVTRTWTAIDDCGNTSECSRTVVVQDNTPPVITCPVVVSPLECGTAPTFGTPTAIDACDGTVDVSFTDETIPGSCPQEYSVTRTWTAIDDCGNTSECSRTVVVQDNTPPVITCPVVVSPLECGTAPTFGTPTAIDACDGTVDVSFTDETIPGSCPQEYSVTRTWTAIDDCGNTSECSRTVVVQDNTPPVITCPVVVSPLECGTAPTFSIPTAIDACDGTVDVSFTDETIPGSCPQEYSVTRTWTAIDDCGNTSQCSRTVVVQDNTPPVITCPVVVSPIECGTAPTFGTPTAVDACDGTVDVSFTDETIPGSCPQEYSVTRTWTAIDDCGNTSECSRTVVLQDNTPPVITCPVVVSPIECGTAPTFGTPTAIDACDGTVDVSFTDETIPGSCPQEYNVTRTWTAIDDCGNTSQCSLTVVVQDNTPPVITCPVVVSPLECGTAPTFSTPTAIDACDGTVDVSFTDETIPGSCPQEYSVTRTWTAIDDCGNTSQCSRTVVLQDNTAPVITCPVVVSPIECGTAPTFGTPTAVDACDGTVDVSFTDETIPGSCPQEYSVTRTWTAIDDCGNTSECSRTVVVQDNAPPVITCPVVVSPVECGTAPTFGTPTAIDACDGTVDVSFTDETVPGSCPQEYSVTRTWTAIDDCGNTSECSRTVVVQDNTPPVITCPVVVSPLECGTAPTFGTPTAIDACDGTVDVSFTDETIPGSCPQEYSVTRTWTAIDDCGNTSQCSRTIVIQDNTPPVITCPVVVSPVECGTAPTFGTPTAIDACDGTVDVSFTDETVPGSCPQEYSVTRTWTAIDDCGNTSQCSRTVIIQDNTPPVITCPVVVSPIECGTAPNFGTPIVIDACDGTVDVSFTDETIPGSCPQEYSVTRTWTAIDDCGNTSQCSRTVVVQDNTPPSIECPENLVVECEDQVPAANPTSIISSDNCGGPVTVTLVSDVISGQICANNYQIIRTYQTMDECGNSNTCTQSISVLDTIPPTILFTNPLLEGAGDTIYVQCYGQDPNWDIPEFDETSVEATDNCGENVIVTFSQSAQQEGNCEEDGYIVLNQLTWTATDICGNSSSAFVFVALIDTIPPVLHGIPDDVSINCDQMPEPPTIVFATDECLCACIIQFEETIPVQGCQDGIVIVRSWTARDRCGNESTATQNITLIDHDGPILEIMQPELTGVTDGTILSYTCNEGGIPDFFDYLNAESVFSQPSCGGSVSITFDSETITANNCEFSGFVVQHTFHWHAVDLCGNASDMTLIIHLIDNEPPVLTGIHDFACIDDPSLNEVDATDNCGSASVRFWDVAIQNPCGEGTAMRRTYEAYDPCGNITRDTSILIPNNLDHPTMVFLNPVMAELVDGELFEINCSDNDGLYSAFGVDDVSMVGACMLGMNIQFSETLTETGDCLASGRVGLLELKWKATDVCGNLSELSIMANLIDTSGPVFVQFQPVVTIGCQDEMPVIITTDHCGDVVITTSDSLIPGVCLSEYTVYRSISATDACGNTSTRVQLIHVGDGLGPVIEGVIKEICDDLTIPLVTGFDACAGEAVEVTMTEDTLDVPCRDGLVIERIWTAVDLCGHIREIHQTIVINDITPPEIQIPSYSIINKLFDAGIQVVYISQNDLMDKLNALNEHSVFVLDDCDQEIIPVLTVDTTLAVNCLKDGYKERRQYTWTATDICGNSASISFQVDIMDDVPPVFIIVPADTTVICAPLPPVSIIHAEDATSPVSIVYSEIIVPGIGPGVYVVTRTWVATDPCGNVSVYIQHIKWIPDSFIECSILIPELVECNSHGVIISSEMFGGVGDFIYLWQIAGEKCFIQSGQGTPDIAIYVGWADVVIILTVTDAFGCVSICTVTLSCVQSDGLPVSYLPLFLDPDTNPELHAPAFPDYMNNEGADYLKDVKLSPNPANGMMRLSFETSSEEEVEYNFTNFLGQEILSDKITAHKGFNSQKIDISKIPEGSYLVQLKTGLELHTIVAVIMRSE